MICHTAVVKGLPPSRLQAPSRAIPRRVIHRIIITVSHEHNSHNTQIVKAEHTVASSCIWWLTSHAAGSAYPAVTRDVAARH